MTTTQHDTGPAARLQIKPDTTASGYVDGGWWPRTSDPVDEFRGLVKAATSTVGPVNRIAYDLDAWGPVPRKLTVQDQRVRLEGFRTMRPHTVTLVGPARRTTLLVIPPDTPGGSARAILRAASDPDTTSSADDILASNGIGGREA